VECTASSSQWRAVHTENFARAGRVGIVFRAPISMISRWKATGRNLARVSYATSLMKKGVLISTRATCFPPSSAPESDNAIVELEQPRVADPRRQSGLLWK